MATIIKLYEDWPLQRECTKEDKGHCVSIPRKSNQEQVVIYEPVGHDEDVVDLSFCPNDVVLPTQ